jgi:hypothetical protein
MQTANMANNTVNANTCMPSMPSATVDFDQLDLIRDILAW